MLSLLAPLIVVVAPAEAANQDEAEHTRLAEEMRRLASRNAWRGVEAGYTELLALEKRGIALTYDDHYLGAQAASNLGDINATYERLKRASAVAGTAEEGTVEVRNWLRDIRANYGEVALKVAPKYEGEVTLQIAEMPFAPDQRAAYDRARAQISQNREYTGLLPLGQYTLSGGGASEPFAVTADGDPIALTLAPTVPGGGGGGGGLAYIGPRVDVGGVLSSVSAPSADAEGLVPDGFAGPGLRAGLGVELGTRSGVGGLLEVGYHGIGGGLGADPFAATAPGSSASVGESYGLEQGRTSLHSVYTWAAVSYRLRGAPLTVLAGPVYSIGFGSAQGTSGSAAANIEGGDERYVVNIASEDGGGGQDAVSGEDLEFSADHGAELDESLSPYTQLNGSIRAGGFSGGVSIAPRALSMGRFGGAISLLVGAQSDTARWYSWGQLALTLTPATIRRDG